MAQQTQFALTIAIITESGTPEAFSFLSASREVSRAEYHLWHGETIHPADQASPWKSQLGEGRFRPFQPLLLSSKYKSDTWDSRSKHVPVQWRYGIGASGIRIGATYRSGCLGSGEALWSHTSVARRDPPIKPSTIGKLRSDAALECCAANRPHNLLEMEGI